MIEIGKYNKLRALRHTPPGMYLGKDNEEEVVLLPNKYVPKDLEEGQEIEVFIYKDSMDDIVATTLEPKIKLHEFGCLQVVDVNQYGAFLDWGLEKHLMVPYREQRKSMRPGEYHLIYLLLDKETERLVATTKINKYLDKGELTVEEGDKVDLLIGEKIDIGITVIINNRHKGLLYQNEVFRKISPGERTEGYIKTIREDNKIDVSLQPQGFANIDPSAEMVLEKLKAAGGYLYLTDKSDPEDIMHKMQMSKKTYKKAIGVLYKKRIITIDEDGIRLVNEQ